MTDADGTPLADVPVDVWHADDEGFYDSQKPSYDIDGCVAAWTIRDRRATAASLSAPSAAQLSDPDRRTGRPADQGGQPPSDAARLMCISSSTRPGYEPLVTHVFIEGDDYLASDAVFGVKDELVREWCATMTPRDARRQAADGPWYRDDLRISRTAR